MVNYFILYCTKHKEISTCKCGANTICHNCGDGSGAYPCQCTPEIKYIPMEVEIPNTSNYADSCTIKIPKEKSWDETIEEVLEDRAEAWEKLANE